MNSTPLLAICAAILLPNLAQAATVTSLVEVRSTENGATQGEVVNETATDTPQSLMAATPDPDRAKAQATTDVENWNYALRSDVEKPAGGDPSEDWARARTEMTQSYEVVGTGKVVFEMDFSVGMTTLTDRNDGTNLSHVIAGFEAETLSEEVYMRVSNRDPDSFLFDQGNAALAGTLMGEIAVIDGEMLTISAFGLADAGEFPLDEVTRFPQSAFFDVSAISNATLSFMGEGVRLIPVEMDVAPVPLPASLPLLIGGLGALAAYRRRRAPRS
ncbi:MAG: VPLPA-CTERM sorting domain-containing protein [Pseudomonadota bacterium]